MPLLQQYATPAGIDDFAHDPPTGIAFRAAWHKEIRGIVTPEQPPELPPDGEPGFDAARGARSRAGSAREVRAPLDPAPAAPEPQPAEPTAWIDPLTEDAVKITARSLSWIAFPRKVLPARRRDDRARAFAEVEANRSGDQDEYFEWHATRRPEDDKIVKVVFVTETPEYWRLLATTSDTTRARLVQLYQELVSPDVQEADLFVEQPTGDGASVVKVYDELNRWHTTDGIVHFIVGINNVSAAIGSLARPAALGSHPVDAYADPGNNGPTSVDNYIPRDISALVRNGHRVTVADPVGLYIDGWDDTGWTKPDGSPVGNYWRITRGKRGLALRVEYEVPKDVEDREGFVVGDIRIGGRPITHGGQIAEHMTASLPIVVYRGLS
jgi:hypothetical protein